MIGLKCLMRAALHESLMNSLSFKTAKVYSNSGNTLDLTENSSGLPLT